MTKEEIQKVYNTGYQDGWDACAKTLAAVLPPKWIGFGTWMKSKVAGLRKRGPAK